MATPLSSPHTPLATSRLDAGGAHQGARLPVQLSSFVGREREIASARQRLATTRLLTLTGAGGAGKTRLALEVAARELPTYGDEVTWVELAPVGRGSLVADTVLTAVGAHEQPGRSASDTLIGVLRDRAPVLLVLDNCEHVVDACAALVDALLRACPALRILATSREALGVAGEAAWLVPPLSLPTSPAALEESEAVQLFVERARSAVPDFALTATNAAAVAQICQRLDGLPLALELAAARLRALPVEQIAARLDDRFRLLATRSRTALPRHQTLRAAIAWSYDLLAEPERRLLERAAVFSGSFTLDGAEAVCAGGALAPDDVLDLVTSLVEKSLVTLVPAGDTARYRMLETVRQYALDRLAERGEMPEYRGRHARVYAALVAEAAPHLVTARRREWTERLQRDVDNIRDALAWTAEHDALLHLELAGMLCWFWYSSGLWAEGRQWLDAALALPAAAAPTPERAGVLFAAGVLATLQGQPAVALPWLEESARLARSVGDARLEAYALNYVGMALGQQGDARCVPPAEAALAWCRSAGDLYGLRLALLILGTYYLRAGEVARARTLTEEAVQVARAFGPERELGIALSCLGSAVMAQGELARGAAVVRESLEAFQRDPQFMFVARSLELLGGLAILGGNALEGATLCGAGAAVRQSIDATSFKLDSEWLAPHVASGRAAVGDEAFARAWDAGRAMSMEVAIEYALRLPAPTVSDDAGPATPRSGERPALRVRALGPLEIHRDGALLPASAWSYAKPRELLLLLLTHPEGRTREQVGLALWPDASAAQVRNNFHVTLHHVRKVLGGAEWVRFDRERYRIAPDRTVEFDAAIFEAAATAAFRSARRQSPESVDELRAALALYRGDFLDGEAVGDWHLELRDRLQRLHADAGTALSELLVRAERYAEAAEVLRGLLRADELNEGACRRLMLCLARLGERTAALQQYRELEQRLRAELGTCPDPATSALFQQLQRGDAA